MGAEKLGDSEQKLAKVIDMRTFFEQNNSPPKTSDKSTVLKRVIELARENPTTSNDGKTLLLAASPDEYKKGKTVLVEHLPFEQVAKNGLDVFLDEPGEKSSVPAKPTYDEATIKAGLRGLMDELIDEGVIRRGKDLKDFFALHNVSSTPTANELKRLTQNLSTFINNNNTSTKSTPIVIDPTKMMDYIVSYMNGLKKAQIKTDAESFDELFNEAAPAQLHHNMPV